MAGETVKVTAMYSSRAQQQPVHPEQAVGGRVQEQIDRLGLGHPALGGELNGVHPVERLVVALADQRLESRHRPRAPRPRRFERREALLQQPIIDRDVHERPSDGQTSLRQPGCNKAGCKEAQGVPGITFPSFRLRIQNISDPAQGHCRASMPD
jgi:hypothetical protein